MGVRSAYFSTSSRKSTAMPMISSFWLAALAAQLFSSGISRAAGGAPGGPEIHHQRLARPFAQTLAHLAVAVRQFELRAGFPAPWAPGRRHRPATASAPAMQPVLQAPTSRLAVGAALLHEPADRCRNGDRQHGDQQGAQAPATARDQDGSHAADSTGDVHAAATAAGPPWPARRAARIPRPS